jgi:hypothetical protein
MISVCYYHCALGIRCLASAPLKSLQLLFGCDRGNVTDHIPDKYISQKGSIVGPMFKMPFIGPFLQSVNPKFAEYHAKWMSGR